MGALAEFKDRAGIMDSIALIRVCTRVGENG